MVINWIKGLPFTAGRRGGRTGGAAPSESLAPAGARRPAPPPPTERAPLPPVAAGPGTGQRIPGRRARCPVVTPGPRSAGVNDRRRAERRCAARSAGGPGRPLRRHHIALSPSNTPRAAPLAGPRPRPHAPASGLGAGPGLRPWPSDPSLCAPRARAGAPQPGLAWPGAAPARPPAEPRCRRGAERQWPASVHIRGGLGEGHEEARARSAAASPPAAPAQSQAPPAAPGLPQPPVRGGAPELGPVPGARGPAWARPGLARTPPPVERLRRAGVGITPGPAGGGPAPVLIGLQRGVNCQPMWRGRRRWRLLK